MISSTANSQVKQVAALGKKAKYRKETGLFVVEGPKMFEELPPERIESVYVTENFLKAERQKAAGKQDSDKSGEKPGGSLILEKLKKVRKVETVTDEVLKAMSDTQTPQGILALARQYRYSLKDVLNASGKAHLMILETLQDPGNLGTILRAGEGAGITGVIMNEDTADIYNPKVIRSTMGSVFRVPFVYVSDLKEALGELKKNGIRLYAAHLKGVNSYDMEDYTGDIGFLIGNEAKGLSDGIADMADTYVKIPMAGKVESLNAAIASSILMYEAARQRRNHHVRKM